MFDVLSRFEQYTDAERKAAPERIAALVGDPSIDVFALDERMLTRGTEIAAATALDLKPFDVAILAAVLVRGAALHADGNAVSFCTLDDDLRPWDRNGHRRTELADLFDAAGMTVFRNFLMTN